MLPIMTNWLRLLCWNTNILQNIIELSFAVLLNPNLRISNNSLIAFSDSQRNGWNLRKWQRSTNWESYFGLRHFIAHCLLTSQSTWGKRNPKLWLKRPKMLSITLKTVRQCRWTKDNPFLDKGVYVIWIWNLSVIRNILWKSITCPSKNWKSYERKGGVLSVKENIVGIINVQQAVSVDVI